MMNEDKPIPLENKTVRAEKKPYQAPKLYLNILGGTNGSKNILHSTEGSHTNCATNSNPFSCFAVFPNHTLLIYGPVVS
jgi:hypothetical protein